MWGQVILTTRELLESAVARMAANQITSAQIRRFEECLDAMCESISRIEYDVYSANNRAFHRIICDASKTKTIPEMIDLLRSRLARLPLRTLLIPGRCDQSLAEHKAILLSLKSGNAKEAESNAKKHMKSLKTVIKNSWNLIRN